MTRYYSPKEVACAIGVSESSLKRWVDKGTIDGTKTAGGHRRMELSAVLHYVRSSSRLLRDPSAIDLPDGCGTSPPRPIEESRGLFLKALIDGEERDACRIILNQFLAGSSIAVLSDLVIAPAFHDLGDLWKCGDVQVYEERRSCELCMRVIHELRRSVGDRNDGRLAMGATLDGDPYTVAVSLCELVLRDLGWRANSIGAALPFEAVQEAILAERPELFWISVTTISDEDRFVTDFNLLYDVAQSASAALVVGGQAITTAVRERIRATYIADDFRGLGEFARGLQPRLAETGMTPESQESNS